MLIDMVTDWSSDQFLLKGGSLNFTTDTFSTHSLLSKKRKKIKSREIKKNGIKIQGLRVYHALIVLVTENTVISIKLRNILYKPHVIDEDFVVSWYAWTLIFFSSFLLINEDIYDNSYITHHIMWCHEFYVIFSCTSILFYITEVRIFWY